MNMPIYSPERAYIETHNLELLGSYISNAHSEGSYVEHMTHHLHQEAWQTVLVL